MNPAERLQLTADEYFEWEKSQDVRHEFHLGEVFAMSGGTLNHARLQSSLIALLSPKVRERGCEVFTADARVEIEAGARYVYPDLSVVCGEVKSVKDHTLQNPSLIIEVLSPSSEAYDRGLKSQLYRALPSLETYVLVSQDQALVEVYSRHGGGRWVLESFSGLEASARLPSLEVELPLAEVYRQVELPASPPSGLPGAEAWVVRRRGELEG